MKYRVFAKSLIWVYLKRIPTFGLVPDLLNQYNTECRLHNLEKSFDDFSRDFYSITKSIHSGDLPVDVLENEINQLLSKYRPLVTGEASISDPDLLDDIKDQPSKYSFVGEYPDENSVPFLFSRENEIKSINIDNKLVSKLIATNKSSKDVNIYRNENIWVTNPIFDKRNISKKIYINIPFESLVGIKNKLIKHCFTIVVFVIGFILAFFLDGNQGYKKYYNRYLKIDKNYEKKGLWLDHVDKYKKFSDEVFFELCRNYIQVNNELSLNRIRYYEVENAEILAEKIFLMLCQRTEKRPDLLIDLLNSRNSNLKLLTLQIIIENKCHNEYLTKRLLEFAYDYSNPAGEYAVLALASIEAVAEDEVRKCIITASQRLGAANFRELLTILKNHKDRAIAYTRFVLDHVGDEYAQQTLLSFGNQIEKYIEEYYIEMKLEDRFTLLNIYKKLGVRSKYVDEDFLTPEIGLPMTEFIDYYVTFDNIDSIILAKIREIAKDGFPSAFTAIRALAKFKDLESYSIFLDYCKSENTTSKTVALCEIGKLDYYDQELIDIIVNSLDDEDARITVSALTAIIQLRIEENSIESRVLKLVYDPNESVSSLAKEAKSIFNKK